MSPAELDQGAGGVWLVLVHADDPTREVGLVALDSADLGRPIRTDGMEPLRVAYAVPRDRGGADLPRLVARWLDFQPLSTAPGSRGIVLPSGRTDIAPLPEHGLVTNRTRPGLATGGERGGRPPEASAPEVDRDLYSGAPPRVAVPPVDTGSVSRYSEGAPTHRRTVASPGPGGSAPGPFCVWCGAPMSPGTRGPRKLTCSDPCRRARSRSRRRGGGR